MAPTSANVQVMLLPACKLPLPDVIKKPDFTTASNGRHWFSNHLLHACLYFHANI
ncbi:hypothetical protein ACMA1I_21010 [Pontibacter sp. 13R65]|uniref:hypothetical protein n=1 Tax=Pontibacter sp. 13R65 TaxID=3127458 RepID=UPI00301C259B